ncbi:hypothetical protein EZV62_008141 [Acer yangbiense]|uniref:PRA1 family protein n=1 Tax=Acer yangbiense TaxID=1000413 RepID=A0A5C7IEL8_9ROSI|nr:hypothetical protein EZV62_008141 [Acer yangbiense]
MGRVFTSNPLSLSVPDPAFESWLRDSGYLEVLDNSSSSSSAAAANTTASTTSTTVTHGILHHLWTLVSLFTVNPFSKLTTDDFSAATPSWTREFLGFLDSYAFPSSPETLRLRVLENVKRYARNYASLFILFFACSLNERWKLDQYPLIRQILIRIAQCATVVILICLNVQMALFSAFAVSYTVMLLHAAFRKLSPVKQTSWGRSIPSQFSESILEIKLDETINDNRQLNEAKMKWEKIMYNGYHNHSQKVIAK